MSERSEAMSVALSRFSLAICAAGFDSCGRERSEIGEEHPLNVVLLVS